jgi:hypothetical protein
MIKRVFLTIIYVTLAFGRKENFFITQTTFLINLYFHFISKMKQLKYLFDNLQNKNESIIQSPLFVSPQ